jgi:hypothetical protein
MKKFNSNHLKLIAIIAMTLDHIADLLYPGMPNNMVSNILHVIGRLTAPIMFFFICEGFFYTKDVKKYIMRLFAFAIISHFAYCFAFGINYIPFSTGEIFNQTSIMWTLAWSVVALYIVYGNNKFKEWQKLLLVILLNVITFSADWSSIGLMIILSMYEHRGNVDKQIKPMMFWTFIYAIVSFLFVSKVYGIIQLFVVLAYPLLKMYNGKKGNAKWMKWFFYVYYPLHLIIIGILRIVLYGNIPILF